MIVNIRGTNGSGKSTLVLGLMTKYGRTAVIDTRNNKEIGYHIPELGAHAVGKYTTACGGCDTIKTQDETKERVKKWSAIGHVVFEGILVSTIFGPWLDFSRQNGGMMWAFLDTPLDLCLERIQIRNGGKPVKTDQVKSKWEGMFRIADKAKAAGEQVVWVDHQDPVDSLLGFMLPAILKKVA